MNVFRRLALSVMVSAAVGVPVVSQAQSCPSPPGTDVLLFVDNSSSIENTEYDAAQQAIAGIASDVLSRPGYRLAVVNWACNSGDENRDGCRLDLATGAAIPGGWSSNPADFAYAGNNSASNRVCRSFGYSGTFAPFLNRNNCGGDNFTVSVAADYAQHAFKMLEGALFSGGSTGGSDGYGAATLAPSAPSQRLMIIHLTDAATTSTSRIREVPAAETVLGHYYYSNRLKNMRDVLIVGVGINNTDNLVDRPILGALSSKGGVSSEYDLDHQIAPSTQVSDVGAPRLATFSSTFNAADILAAATSAFDDAVPACVAIRKQSIGGTGSFSFTNGTNGLPSSLTLNTTTTNPATSAGYLTQLNADTSIREVVPSGYVLSSIGCTNANGSSVPVTTDLNTGQLTIPGSEVVAGAELTCTFTNARRGSITIIKDAVPNHAQNVGFTTTGTGLSTTIYLDDDAEPTLSNTYTFNNLAPGSYSVTEMAQTGSDLTGLTCVDPDSGSTVDLAARTATIDLDAGETVTCTYTNTHHGSITIIKDAVPNHAQDFAFTTTGTGLSNFSLDDDTDGTLSNTRTFTGLAPGGYSITETALAGWNLAGLTCVDPDSGSTVDLSTRMATIDLDAGETVTCRYTNTLRQTDIQVVKTASPNPVVSSDVVTYQIVVTNNGPLAADGAVLTDVAGVGQDCTTPSTTATCSATGGATCPSPTVPVSSLLGSGITIPTLPVGGQVTIGLQCTVSASGTP
jgi:uncharacterized repeat protein (TIGR01451 family)